MEKGRTYTAGKVKNVPLIEINTAPRILMIVTNKDSLDANKETKLKNDLEATFNATVELAQSDTDIDVGAWDPKRYRLIICCNGVTPTDVNNLKATRVPVISLDEDVSVTALNMAGSGDIGAAVAINVTDITHQITSEALRDIDPTSIATGAKAVYSAASGIDHISTLGTGGKSLSQDITTASEEYIVVYDEGAILQDGSLAADIRIHLGLYQFNVLTATGKELFRHAVAYAIYGGRQAALEDIEAKIDQLLQAGGGTLGIFHGMPVTEHERGVFWFKPSGTNDADASTAANAATGAYNSITTYCTANKDDVAIFLQGSYDFSGAVGGLAISIRGVHIFGLGGVQCSVVNTNASAAVIFTISTQDCEVAGFYSTEATTTVEFILCTSGWAWIHDNEADGTMENGIHLDGTGDASRVYNNFLKNMTNDGIEISVTAGTMVGNHIFNNRIDSVGDNGIHINGNAIDSNFIIGNIINGGAGSTDVGIKIALGDNNMVVGNWIGECTVPYSNTGSNNIITGMNHIAPVTLTSSLAYDVSAITEETPNANTRIITIDNATYPSYRLSKIYINIKTWHTVADAAEELNILQRLEVDNAGSIGADDNLEIINLIDAIDIENVVPVNDVEAVVDYEVYVYTGAAMGAADDFTIYYTYTIYPK